jgi:DNA-binding MarR family transcriptional regulator
MKNFKVSPGAARAADWINRLHRFYAESADFTPELDAVLCHILECNLAKVPVCSTDLVRLQRFGTLPTITARLASLVQEGLVKQVVSDDRRIKLLQVTPKGVASLEARDRLLDGSRLINANSSDASQ